MARGSTRLIQDNQSCGEVDASLNHCLDLIPFKDLKGLFLALFAWWLDRYMVLASWGKPKEICVTRRCGKL